MTTQYHLHAAHHLSDQVCQILHAYRGYWSRSVEAAVIDRQIVLTGSVSSYYHKQLAQESLRPVEGIDRIVNRLEVRTANRAVSAR
jgi:osmotically-inducible protein OsmY